MPAPAARARRHPADALEPLRDDFDRLIGELREGITSQPHFDRLEERAQALGAAIVAVFRGARR